MRNTLKRKRMIGCVAGAALFAARLVGDALLATPSTSIPTPPPQPQPVPSQPVPTPIPTPPPLPTQPTPIPVPTAATAADAAGAATDSDSSASTNAGADTAADSRGEEIPASEWGDWRSSMKVTPGGQFSYVINGDMIAGA